MFEFFLKILPIEKILDPPLFVSILVLQWSYFGIFSFFISRYTGHFPLIIPAILIMIRAVTLMNQLLLMNQVGVFDLFFIC